MVLQLPRTKFTRSIILIRYLTDFTAYAHKSASINVGLVKEIGQFHKLFLLAIPDGLLSPEYVYQYQDGFLKHIQRYQILEIWSVLYLL